MEKNILDDCYKKMNNQLDLSWDELAHKHNIKSGEILRCRFKKYRSKQGEFSVKKYNFPQSVSINSDGSYTDQKIIKANNSQLKDIDFLLKEHGYDSNIFELIKAVSSKWNTYSKQDGIKDLYSSKIWVKKKNIPLSLELICKEFVKNVNKYKPKYFQIKHNTDGKKYTLEIPLFDVHFGKVAFESETGNNYNIDICKNNIWKVIEDLLAKINLHEIKQIIFPIGNDFFNYDTINGTTVKGTYQDNCVHFQQMFVDGCQLIVDILIALSKIASVKVFYIPANHDEMTSFYMLSYLDAWFKEDKNIEIDKSIKPRYYLNFGKNLIGYSHGNLEKKRIKTIMQTEVSKLWGNSDNREWHLGHYHSEHVIEEDSGVIIRNLSSITSNDRWHNKSGYVGAKRKLQSYLWHDDNGIEYIINSYI